MGQVSSYSQWVRATLSRGRREGVGLVSLFDSHPTEPVELLRATIERGFATPLTDRYTSAFSNGNPFVVARLAERYGRDASNFLTTTGATSAISLLYRALLSAGDRLLVEAPTFDLFADIAGMAGLVVDSFHRHAPDYTVDPAALDAAIRPDTKLVVISNLHNPTGAVLRPADLQAIATVAERRKVFVLFDEVYLPYAEEDGAASAADFSDRFIVIGSLTKMYALAALRCGWILAHPNVIARVRDIADRTEFGISNLAHAVAALVLDDPAPFAEHCRSIVRAALPVVGRFYRHWHDEGLVDGPAPIHGCISFPRLVGIDDTAAFSESLVRRSGVVVAPGEYFGAPGYIRLGHAKPVAVLEPALERLTEELRIRRSRPEAIPLAHQGALS